MKYNLQKTLFAISAKNDLEDMNFKDWHDQKIYS